MPRAEATTYLRLDSRQGLDAADGWRVEDVSNLQVTAEGLRLTLQPSAPVPLKDDAGTFGGLEKPTGVAVAPDGSIYVSDSSQHLIYKITRRDGLPPRAHFFRVAGGARANERFVYIPTANRVELWPRALGRDPRSYAEVTVVCETVWSEEQARRVALDFANGVDWSCAKTEHCCDACRDDCREGCGCKGGGTSRVSGCGGGGGCSECQTEETAERATIDKEWDDAYPSGLPAGEACRDSIEFLSCLGGLGRAPRQFDEPRGLAISDAGNLYVADSRNHRVQVFRLRGLLLKAVWGKRAGTSDLAPGPSESGADCEPGQSVKLGGPMAGDAPGQFDEPWDVVADARGNVYVADKGNHRLQKYDCRKRRFQVIDGTTLAAHFFQVLYGPSFRDRFVYIPARRRLEIWPHALGHDPASIDEVVLVNEDVSSLEEARRLVLAQLKATGARDVLVEYRKAYPPTLAGDPQPEPAFDSPTHLAIDKQGRLYVVDAGREFVKILDDAGRVLGRVEFAEDLQGKFKPTAIAVDADGKLVLASESGAHRFDVSGEHSFYQDFYAAWRARCSAMIEGGDGKLITVGGASLGVAELRPPQAFLKQGTYVSRALDSEIENCQWHKLVLDFGAGVPEATSLKVSTFSAPFELTPAEIQSLDEREWLTNQTNATDFLVLSAPGRYLWLRIEMRGDGAETPLLRGLKAYFPRDSYLQYLPAVYQADPVGKDFLERFLSIFETILGSVEEKVENIWQLFDPNGVPADAPHDFLSWLAGWVDMPFDRSWSTETRRGLLRRAPELYRKRGTPSGLQLLLKLALGVDVRIVEHYQLRRWLFLSSQGSLCDSSQLWNNCVVQRLQLDECARVGVSGLIYTPDPLRDPFFVYAYKFSVYVQGGAVRSELVERMMRHLIEQEKPAQTQFDVVKVEPRFRVGVQSTVGLDTHVGAYPRMALNHCATLGYDTLLGGEAEDDEPPVLRVGERARVGVSTVVG